MAIVEQMIIIVQQALSCIRNSNVRLVFKGIAVYFINTNSKGVIKWLRKKTLKVIKKMNL